MVPMKISNCAGENNLLDQSLQKYSEMLELLQDLQLSFESKSTEEITDFNATFSALREDAAKIDKNLFQEIDFTNLTDQLNHLLERRKKIIKNIMVLLQINLPKANRVKSLLASEMTSVGSGRKALGGYKPEVKRQGRLINKAG